MLYWLKNTLFQKKRKEKNKSFVTNNKFSYDNINSIVCLLGPYRNLSTLTASIAALHPNCQVLNHAGEKILNNDSLDFFSNYSNIKFNSFLDYAIDLSGRGERGRKGGSILFSHAFDNSELMALYSKRFGSNLIKDRINSVLWKESLILSNHLVKNGVDLLSLVKKNSRIKFLLPIRNVFDCVYSNLKTGLGQTYPEIEKNSSFKDLLSVILSDYLKFFQAKKTCPDNFFHFYENQFKIETLKEFCKFANLPYDKGWANDAMSIFSIKSKYSATLKEKEIYVNLVNDLFSDYPEEKKSLLSF